MSVTTELAAHARMAIYRPAEESEQINAGIAKIMQAEHRSKSNTIRLLLSEALRARGYEVGQ